MKALMVILIMVSIASLGSIAITYPSFLFGIAMILGIPSIFYFKRRNDD